MEEKGEIWKKERMYCVAGVLNGVNYKNNTHISGISIYYIPKDVAVWPNGRVRSSTLRRF